MNLKFIGLSLILVLTVLCGFGFGGEIFAAGEGWCAPVNFGSARITAAAVGTPDRGNGVTVFGMTEPAVTGMEKLLPDSWKNPDLSVNMRKFSPAASRGCRERRGKGFAPISVTGCGTGFIRNCRSGGRLLCRSVEFPAVTGNSGI